MERAASVRKASKASNKDKKKQTFKKTVRRLKTFGSASFGLNRNKDDIKTDTTSIKRSTSNPAEDTGDTAEADDEDQTTFYFDNP